MASMPQKWLLFPFSVLLLSFFPSRPCFCRLCFDFGQNVKERWSNNQGNLFFIRFFFNVCANRMQSDESWLSKAMLRCSLILLKAKNNTRTPKSKFWNDIISNLKSFPHPQKCIQPFIYRYFSMFYTQKNEHNISFYSYFQNVQKHAFTPHILNGNSMNGAAYCGHKESAASQVNFATQHLTMYLFSEVG